MVGDTTGGGWRSTGDDVGSGANLFDIKGESALLEGANGRFFKIDVLLLFTSLIRVGAGVGLRSSSAWNKKCSNMVTCVSPMRSCSLTFVFDGTLRWLGLRASALLPAGRSGVPCFCFLLSCKSCFENCDRCSNEEKAE